MFDFDYLQPKSVTEASRMLADLGDDARLIAGGTALMLALRQRMLRPSHLISLAQIDRLRGIEIDSEGWLCIGAANRHVDVAQSALVKTHQPVFADVAARLANPQVRNQGTLGGNICYADPATDPSGCLIALGAQVILGSSRGERALSLQEFLVDYYATALEPDEILLTVRMPATAPGVVVRYTRHLRTAAEHRPLVNFTTVAQLNGGTCAQVHLVIGASTVVPTRCVRAETYLAGKLITADTVSQASQMIAADIEPISDVRGSGDYRRAIAQVVAERNLSAVFGLNRPGCHP